MATTATVALTTVTPSPANASPGGSALDEDAAKKKNTDCVYFLASPLTCKKGDECEFRHSESARLNPRDCWYWVGGNCLNRDCPFRHPPLEPRGAAPVHPPPAQAKKPVPCFFFSQGCCVKGAKCQYLHGQKEQHDNPSSGAMVYRLDANNNRPKPDTDGEARKETERKKDNVYRLQDESKKAKPVARETSDGGSDSQSEQQQQQPAFRRKQHKENAYTWNRRENTPQKQPVKQDRAEKSKPSSAERKRLAPPKESQQQEGSEPLLHKGKRKLDVGDNVVEQEEARRKLSNGAAAAGASNSLESHRDEIDGSTELAADEEAGQGTQSGPSDEDEDFARKLGHL